MESGAPPSVAPDPVSTPGAGEDLRARYDSYRLRQAARLVRMLPEGAVRPLYRRARLEALRSRDGLAEDLRDPLDVLVRYCARVLPLPPFEVWREDLASHPRAHRAEQQEADSVGPTADAPATLDERTFECDGYAWRARLRSYREADVWRAFIAFEGPWSGGPQRTAPVFCERDVWGLLERFDSFEDTTLRAFLRSALP